MRGLAIILLWATAFVLYQLAALIRWICTPRGPAEIPMPMRFERPPPPTPLARACDYCGSLSMSKGSHPNCTRCGAAPLARK